MPDGEQILLVDDDAEVISVIREFLEGRGHTVQVARTGAEALAALDASAFELVLLDLRLPDVDTATLLREVPRRPGAPDVIVITGYPALESAITALETGAVGYFVKPFDFPRLDEAIGKVLERRRLARDNARLHAEIADRLRETEALFAISSTLTSTLDVREALRRTCRELARLTGAETVSVHLHDGAADRLMPVAAYHVPKRYLETLAEAPLTLKDQDFYLSLWKERRPVHSDDVVHDPRFAGTLFRAFPHQSGLLLPLSLDEEVAGAFYLVWWTARRRFTERELVPLESICGQVSLLLRNARLFEQTERDRRRLQTLNDVASHLSSVHDTDHVFSLIVHEAAQLLGGEAAVLRLLEGDDLVVAAQSALAGPLVHRPRLKVGVGFGGRIVATGEPLVVSDLRAAGSAVDRDFAQTLLDEGIHAFVGVPLKASGRPVGTLSVYGRRARQKYADGFAIFFLTWRRS